MRVELVCQWRGLGYLVVGVLLRRAVGAMVRRDRAEEAGSGLGIRRGRMGRVTAVMIDILRGFCCSFCFGIFVRRAIPYNVSYC